MAREVFASTTVVSARRHAVSGELIGAGNEMRDRGILITESNQFPEMKLATPCQPETAKHLPSCSLSSSFLLVSPLPFGISSYEHRQRSNQMHRIKLI